MSKPTVVPEWATNTNYDTGPDNGTPTKVAPPSSLVQNGAISGEGYSPVAQYENYIQNLVGQWCAYIDEVTSFFYGVVDASGLDPGQLLTFSTGGSSGISAAGNRIEFTANGVYEVGFSVYFVAGTPAASWSIDVEVDGTVLGSFYTGALAGSGTWNYPVITFTMQFTISDYTTEDLRIRSASTNSDILTPFGNARTIFVKRIS